MSKYEVINVGCDYGVTENGRICVVVKSRHIVRLIVDLLRKDECMHKELQESGGAAREESGCDDCIQRYACRRMGRPERMFRCEYYISQNIDALANELMELSRCPQNGDPDYGRWGLLPLDVRKMVRRAAKLIASMDAVIHDLFERLDEKEDVKL